MECCRTCGEMLDERGVCPACYERIQELQRLKGIKTETPSVQPEVTFAPRQEVRQKPHVRQNSPGKTQNSLGKTKKTLEKTPVPKNSKRLFQIGLAAAIVLIVGTLILVFRTNGYCGDNARWRFNILTGELTITGSGKMNFYNNTHEPWRNLGIRSVKIDGVKNIGTNAFYHCDSLTSVEISDSVTAIGGKAFYHCDSLTSIVIPDSVTVIGGYTFSDCDSLTSVEIPDSVTMIRGYAFSDCDSLTSVRITDSVTTIESGAFNNCSKLTDVYYSGTEAQWNGIDIGNHNSDLTDANIHFES